MKNLRLTNGDLASEQQAQEEIYNKYFTMFDGQAIEDSEWITTEFNRWNFQ